MSRFYRRSRWLAARWEHDRVVVSNYLTGSTGFVGTADVAVLSALTFWRDADELARLFPGHGKRRLGTLLKQFHHKRLVESPGDTAEPRERPLEDWGTWDPVASQFHLATRDVRYASRTQAHDIIARREARVPPPPPIKRVAGGRVELPAFKRDGPFPEVLLARRSWRNFGRRPLSLEELSDLAGLTFAVQQWAEVNGQRVALKTSPSGGACHSIEVYWAVRNVTGLQPGLYHYGPDDHALTRLASDWSWTRVRKYFSGQPWFAKAGAVALLTSVFARTQWKYRDPRAYRVVMLEAGHLCQTFCLTATWLGLAPFCSAALADSEIERDLTIDGVSEAVVYAAGVGSRPAGVDWAPWPGVARQPTTILPSYRTAGATKEQT